MLGIASKIVSKPAAVLLTDEALTCTLILFFTRYSTSLFLDAIFFEGPSYEISCMEESSFECGSKASNHRSILNAHLSER
jgi:hypothetical protein